MRILYIDIDSLRPDHLGCYGYQRPTSPNIDRIASQGVLFTNYFCSDSPCLPSRAACFSARPGIQNGVVAHEDTPIGATLRYGNRERHGEADAPMWMHHLVHNGMNTVSFSSFANRHLAGWFHFGFRQFNLSSLKNGNEDANEVNAVALPWFEQHAREDNWFVHLNYWDPHTLYTEPLSYMRMMEEHPAPAWPDADAIKQQQRLTGVRTPQMLWADSPGEGYGKSRVPTMPDQIKHRGDFEHLINGYDGAIRFADENLGQIFTELERQGIFDETAIIISADHAEAFGELGQYMEHGSVSPAVNRVPLIIKWPGITEQVAGDQRSELLLNIDLAPTVSASLGLKVPTGWAGQSFLPLLEGRALAQPRSEMVMGHGLHTRQRAVYDGRWLYIRTYHPGYFEYPPQMLFDLSIDPYQVNNVAEALPDRLQQMDTHLRNWERENVAVTNQPDPMRLVQHNPPTALGKSLNSFIKRLRSQSREEDIKRFMDRWEHIDTDYAPTPLIL
ncbi:sulfatase [Dictyobacter formicarum]|uniref:Sulfatase n=1 Tax=Dictyobacter formicarum TaxID=2778368 RepID=A0ABQ3VV70_9CHLR|nr:sulfatase [Dictyobacter formicarum]GHO89685.1 sulfatase [Dictyobacter formicarum]